MDSLYDDIFSAQSNTANNKRNYEPEEEDQTKFKNIQYLLFPLSFYHSLSLCRPEYNEENDEDELDKMTMEERLELMDQADVFPPLYSADHSLGLQNHWNWLENDDSKCWKSCHQKHWRSYQISWWSLEVFLLILSSHP